MESIIHDVSEISILMSLSAFDCGDGILWATLKRMSCMSRKKDPGKCDTIQYLHMVSIALCARLTSHSVISGARDASIAQKPGGNVPAIETN